LGDSTSAILAVIKLRKELYLEPIHDRGRSFLRPRKNHDSLHPTPGPTRDSRLRYVPNRQLAPRRHFDSSPIERQLTPELLTLLRQPDEPSHRVLHHPLHDFSETVIERCGFGTWHDDIPAQMMGTDSTPGRYAVSKRKMTCSPMGEGRAKGILSSLRNATSRASFDDVSERRSNSGAPAEVQAFPTLAKTAPRRILASVSCHPAR
jgi:hypothetical protein